MKNMALSINSSYFVKNLKSKPAAKKTPYLGFTAGRHGVAQEAEATWG